MAEEKKPTSKVAEMSTSHLPDHELCPVPSVLVRPEAAQMAEPNRRHQLPDIQPGGPDVAWRSACHSVLTLLFVTALRPLRV